MRIFGFRTKFRNNYDNWYLGRGSIICNLTPSVDVLSIQFKSGKVIVITDDTPIVDECRKVVQVSKMPAIPDYGTYIAEKNIKEFEDYEKIIVQVATMIGREYVP